jgi:hypothetical protein
MIHIYLPRCLSDTWNFTATGTLTKTNSANPKLTQIAAVTSTKCATIDDAGFEFWNFASGVSFTCHNRFNFTGFSSENQESEA